MTYEKKIRRILNAFLVVELLQTHNLNIYSLHSNLFNNAWWSTRHVDQVSKDNQGYLKTIWYVDAKVSP